MRIILLSFFLFLAYATTLDAQRSNRYKDDVKLGYGRFILDNNDVFSGYIYAEYTKAFAGKTSIGLEASFAQSSVEGLQLPENKIRTANFNIMLYYSVWQSINNEHDLRLGVGLSGRLISSEVDLVVGGSFMESTETSFNPGISPMANYDYVINDQLIIGGKLGLQFLEKNDAFYFAGLHVGLKFK